MHIPDGYLSPSTCAATFAAAAPFWYVASRKVGRMLNTKAVPLISVVSAFSFTVMMFNLPLPGGTTGHAVGMGIAAIVLGPWAAMLAISIALLVQAVFFGDGGILAFGANALNMAVVGSLVAYGLYRLIAGASPLASTRRVVAGAIAGYAAINVSALMAAIEFGIQPMLFHDASGAPLYAPYPLSIAIPAMMIGHITFAGLAELIITGGLVAYLQRYDVDLLKATAPGAATGVAKGFASTWRTTRKHWAGLAALMIASPLGLLAAGTAWGEWGAEAFQHPEGRAEIAAASHNIAPPETVPAGLEKLSSFWTAPIPDYAPAFMHSHAFGYILSALVGGGLIILTFLALSALAARLRPETPDAA
ncbi:cobalt transporter CbiM [Rhizobium sp. C4]|uniref:cobalt transporter CbiM n=1 Tax=Rhizobium sp. C4 TaxID=1349800 RepID=UPI001E644180|nr:cobalt transporter CbiM [Rhizobium sp. C4]MCD2175587.1 cobalt transporter CbiM [Rhizobium sp. C4]